MLDRLKLIILVTWREEGRWGFYQDLSARLARVKILQPFLLNSPNRLWRKLSTGLCAFYLPVAAFYQRKHFDAVVTWSTRMGICYGLIKRFLQWGPAPKHILRDFHIDLTRTDFRYRFRLWVLKRALPGIDFFLCTSTEETTLYSKMFHIPPANIRFYPDSPAEDLFEHTGFEVKDYIFAYGNSDRDFETLIRAVRPLDTKLRILSQAFLPQAPLPKNVELISHTVSEEKLISLIGSARLVVLPLEAYTVSAGQNAMIETMALGRPLIVTTNMATVEYAVHHQSAVFVKAQDVDDLRKQIRFLLSRTDLAEKIGRCGREYIRKFTDQEMSIFYDVLIHLLDHAGSTRTGPAVQSRLKRTPGRIE